MQRSLLHKLHSFRLAAPHNDSGASLGVRFEEAYSTTRNMVRIYKVRAHSRQSCAQGLGYAYLRVRPVI